MEKKGRVSSGIYGLDDLIGGGYRENSINIVRGGTGVGKTTFALQYSLFGLNHGENVIYISFEMSEAQILRDCHDMGWYELERYIKDGHLKIIHLFGEDLTFPSLDFSEIIKTSIYSRNPRIVVDPLTYPTFYSEKEKRKSLSTIFQDLRNVGTALIVLEEPANEKRIPESSEMPLYLSDSVIFLQNLGYGEMYDRTLRIMKHRGSKHGDGLYPYSIETGMGIVLHTSEKQKNRIKPSGRYDPLFQEAIEKTSDMGKIGEILAGRIQKLMKSWTREEDPSETLQLIIREESRQNDKRN